MLRVNFKKRGATMYVDTWTGYVPDLVKSMAKDGWVFTTLTLANGWILDDDS
jgi:hypothetical protein